MKYSTWNDTKLKNQYKTLAKQFEADPSMDLGLGMNIIEDLRNNSPNTFKNESSVKQQIIRDKRTIDTYAPFIQSIGVFSAHNEIINSNAGLNNSLNIKSRYITSFLHDFYNSIDREFARYFNRIFKERKNNLRMTPSKKEGYNKSYSYYIKPLNYAYINIHLTRNIDDFFTIIHEYAHTIADQMKYRPQYNKYPFIELLPFFLTEIAYDVFIHNWELDKDKNHSEVRKTDIAMLKQMISYSREIYQESKYIADNSIQGNGEQVLRVNESRLPRFLNPSAKPLDEKIAYVIPYMTMIELYNMYQEDPERALHTVKNIILADDQEDYYKYLESCDIRLNEHLNEFIRSKK